MGMKRETIQSSSELGALSSSEVWAAICYLEPKRQRGTADILVCMVMCWMVLFSCATYLLIHLKPIG